MLWNDLGGESLSTLLSATSEECSGPNGSNDSCLKAPQGPKGTLSSTLSAPKGTLSSTLIAPKGTLSSTVEAPFSSELEWLLWASQQDLSHDSKVTDNDSGENDTGDTVKWVVKNEEPSGSSGRRGRLNDIEFSHVTALLKDIVNMGTTHTVEDKGSTVILGSNTGNRVTDFDQSRKQQKRRESDDYITSSALYYPVAKSMMAQQEYLVSNIYMQVLDELIILWREEEGELTLLKNGGWVLGKNPNEVDDPEKQAEDGFYEEYVGESKQDRLKRKLSEANKGSVESQLWMGKYIYSDNNGDDRVINKARIWFEKAAVQQDAVASYIMGVLHFNRLGGLNRDFDKESEYFLQAVGAFPMAWHALGDLHDSRYKENKRRRGGEKGGRGEGREGGRREGGGNEGGGGRGGGEEGEGESRDTIRVDDEDLLIALEYYSTAAEYNMHESHFCLANIYKTGSPSIPKNIPQAVVHLTQAASLNGIKAVNHLAEAFYDESSWLSEYLRTAALNQTHYQPIIDPSQIPTIIVDTTEKSGIAVFTDFFSPSGWVGMFDGPFIEVILRLKNKIWRLLCHLIFEGMETDDPLPPPSKFTFQYSKRDPVLALSIRKRWAFNSSIPLFITLPGILTPILVPLPHPLWSGSCKDHNMLSNTPLLFPHERVYMKPCRLLEQLFNIDDCSPKGTGQESNGVTAKEISSVLFKYVAEQSQALIMLMVRYEGSYPISPKPNSCRETLTSPLV